MENHTGLTKAQVAILDKCVEVKMTHGEIAKELGVPRGQIFSHFNRIGVKYKPEHALRPDVLAGKPVLRTLRNSGSFSEEISEDFAEKFPKMYEKDPRPLPEVSAYEVSWSRGLTLQENDGCRAVTHNNTEGQPLYCGHEKKRRCSYCGYHEAKYIAEEVEPILL